MGGEGMKDSNVSRMSHATAPRAGRNVPHDLPTDARMFAGWLLVAVGGMVLANTGISSAAPGVTGADWSFALLVVVASVVIARSLWAGARWAWWTSAAYGAVGLFAVLPLTGAIAFGPSTEPVGTGWDVVLFPLITAIMVALLAALWISRPSLPSGRAFREDS